MSRSRNARRGTRAGRRVEAHPALDAFAEEMRQQNIARIGAPKAGDARAIQAANDQAEDARHAEPSWCGCCRCAWAFDDDGYDDFDGYEQGIWDDWQERRSA